LPLTADQAAAADRFALWLEQPADGRPFVLAGFAGTGKTHLSMRLLRRVEERGLCWTVVAPTHKAVDVLRRHLALAGLQATWYPSTLHRLLRLKLRREGDLERCEETRQTAAALEHLGLVLIDEASMVDSPLLEIVLRCAHPFRTRLVFVGDPAQLPPVGEPSSPAFAMDRAERASLTHVVRHQGPVLRLAEGLREGTLPCRTPPVLPPLRTGQGTVALLDRAEWLTAAQEALRRSAERDDPDLARILCYTNRSLERLVPMARRALHGETADRQPVLPGEVLITHRAVMAPACRAGETQEEEPNLVLGSNREVLVLEVASEPCPLAEFGVENSPAGTAVIDSLVATVETAGSRLTLRLLPPLGSAPRGELDEALRKLAEEARAAPKGAARPLWRRFFLVRDAFASLGPAAVLTVHRSQGSTFAEVFVERDVFWPREEELRRQLAYVAVSRASQGVWMVGGPAPRAERERWQEWLNAAPRNRNPPAGEGDAR